VLLSSFLPLLTAIGLVVSVMAVVPGIFLAALPYNVGVAISTVSVASVMLWSVTVSLKRDRSVDILPGFRYMLFALHWVPALYNALRNVFMDTPVVWVKTEHLGHGPVAAPAAPTLASMATVESHPAA
jgi:hypothetical protein